MLNHYLLPSTNYHTPNWAEPTLDHLILPPPPTPPPPPPMAQLYNNETPYQELPNGGTQLLLVKQSKIKYMFNFQPFCEKDYLNTLEKCCKCQEPILDRILRATGKPYHPQVKQFFVYIVKQASLLHIQWDLNNGLFWYSNGPKWSDHGMVCYSNGPKWSDHGMVCYSNGDLN